MKRLLVILVAVLLLATPAQAQSDDDMLAGFKLGKFHVIATLLAADLVYIDSLATELKIDQISDENYAAGIITDEDIFNAQIFIAYVIWRNQFMIQPACETGLDAGSFDHAALAEYKEPMQAILTDLMALSTDFLNGSDLDALNAFVAGIRTGNYAEDMFAMADEAAVAAGDNGE
ncbi:hypothetical protein JW859_04570 [bacterium]|nr:hypothetical protein [bacterium]